MSRARQGPGYTDPVHHRWTVWTLPLALCGCTLSWVPDAGPGQRSDAQTTVVAGRINYIIDGRSMAPYGGPRPAWPAPVMTALNLQTGRLHAFGAVADADGSFRWRLVPGAYLADRIGVGQFTDDTYLAWPGVVLCVPAAPGRVVYLGHLRLEGQRYSETVTLSTGTRYLSRGVRYRLVVVDEGPPADAGEAALVRPMRVAPELPGGDALQRRWQADSASLVHQACGSRLD